MSELPLYRPSTPEIRKVSKFPGRRAGELYLAGREVGRTLGHYVRSVCVGRGPPRSGRRLCPPGGSDLAESFASPSGAETTYVRQGRTDHEIPCLRHTSDYDVRKSKSRRTNSRAIFFFVTHIETNQFLYQLVQSNSCSIL